MKSTRSLSLLRKIYSEEELTKKLGCDPSRRSSALKVDKLYQAVMEAAAIKKLKTIFNDTPEHKLCFAILRQAIQDLRVKKYRSSALNYLNGPLVHAEVCGVDPEWVRHVLKVCNVLPQRERRMRLHRSVVNGGKQ